MRFLFVACKLLGLALGIAEVAESVQTEPIDGGGGVNTTLCSGFNCIRFMDNNTVSRIFTIYLNSYILFICQKNLLLKN